MNNFNYTLIVSQYHHSYHLFVVKFEAENYVEKYKRFVAELCDYKRKNKYAPIYTGDLGSRANTDTIYRRYNLNDEGDIYLINEYSIAGCIYLAKRYGEDALRFSKGYKKKEVLQNISEHHDNEEVKSIVSKYFEIL